jgi:hypothetical protein
MAQTVSVTRLSDSTFRVVVEENGGRTVHEVTATPHDVERYGGPGVDPERLVRASFDFLLEREPKESILTLFALPVIERYFPDYPAAIRRRL